jgi:tetratricopeptide (TPR) repeat protein
MIKFQPLVWINCGFYKKRKINLHMNKIKKIVVALLLLYSTTAFSQNKSDSLQDKIKKIELELNKIKNVPDKLDSEAEKINSKYNNVITNQGNYIAWASLLLTAVSLFFGIIVAKSYIDSKNAKSDVDLTLKEIKKRANESLEKSENVLKESNKNEEVLKQKIISISNQEEKIKAELVKLQKDKDLLKEDVDKIKDEANKFIKEIDERFKIEADKTLELIDLYNQAYEKMNLGSIKIAISKFKKILEFNSNHVGAICKLAMCYSSLDRNALAIDIISPYAKKENEHSAIYSTYGVILRREKEYTLAIEFFTKALEGVFKKNHTTYSHIGYSYLLSDNLLKAKDFFNLSLSLDNNNSPSSYGLLKINAIENPNSVDEDLIKIAHLNAQRDINEHPKYPFPYFGLSFVEVLSNNENCINSMNEAILLCKNLGILKEQLFEYNLFISLSGQFKFLHQIIGILEKEIERLFILYNDFK